MFSLLYYGIGFLNILIPSSLGWIDVVFNMTSTGKGFKLYEEAVCLTISLEVLSCIFLADALRRIKKVMGDQSGVLIDTCTMVLHALSFTLYIAS